jgi:hypothetical protein
VRIHAHLRGPRRLPLQVPRPSRHSPPRSPPYDPPRNAQTEQDRETEERCLAPTCEVATRRPPTLQARPRVRTAAPRPRRRGWGCLTRVGATVSCGGAQLGRHHGDGHPHHSVGERRRPRRLRGRRRRLVPHRAVRRAAPRRAGAAPCRAAGAALPEPRRVGPAGPSPSRGSAWRRRRSPSARTAS